VDQERDRQRNGKTRRSEGEADEGGERECTTRRAGEKMALTFGCVRVQRRTSRREGSEAEAQGMGGAVQRRRRGTVEGSRRGRAHASMDAKHVPTRTTLGPCSPVVTRAPRDRNTWRSLSSLSEGPGIAPYKVF